MMEPHFSRIAAESPPDQFKYYSVDVDQNPNVANEYHIQMLPTFMVYKGNNLIYMQTGTVHDQLRRSLAGLGAARRVSVP